MTSHPDPNSEEDIGSSREYDKKVEKFTQNFFPIKTSGSDRLSGVAAADGGASSQLEREVGRLTVTDIQEKLYCHFEELVPVQQYLSGTPQIISAPEDMPQEVVESLEAVLGQCVQAARPPRPLDPTDSCINRPDELADFATLPPPHLSAPWDRSDLKPEDEPEDDGWVPKTEDEDYTVSQGGIVTVQGWTEDEDYTVSQGGIVTVQGWTEDEECSYDETHLSAYQENDIHKIIFGDGVWERRN